MKNFGILYIQAGNIARRLKSALDLRMNCIKCDFITNKNSGLTIVHFKKLLLTNYPDALKQKRHMAGLFFDAFVAAQIILLLPILQK